MSGINNPSDSTVGKTTLGMDLPSNISGDGLQEELMFLLAQGNSILATAVNIQQNTAIKMQNNLTQVTNALNSLVAALPSNIKTNFYIPVDVLEVLYYNGLLPSSTDKNYSDGVRKFVSQVNAYMDTNPNPVVISGDKKFKIEKVSNDTAMVLKQAIDNFVSQETNNVQKQSTGLSSLTNAISVKQKSMSTLIENNASTFQNIVAQLSKLR